MQWQSFRDKILIKPISSEQSFGGIFIPDTSTNKKKGIVVNVGEGKPGSPMTVKVGDTVLFDQDDSTPITLEEEQYLILREENVWMKK
jgi:chaperonin GroES